MDGIGLDVAKMILGLRSKWLNPTFLLAGPLMQREQRNCLDGFNITYTD